MKIIGADNDRDRLLKDCCIEEATEAIIHHHAYHNCVITLHKMRGTPDEWCLIYTPYDSEGADAVYIALWFADPRVVEVVQHYQCRMHKSMTKDGDAIVWKDFVIYFSRLLLTANIYPDK